MKICGSCGGSFDGNLPKCPYCGTLNEEGAEKEYNEKLYKIRKKLDVVDDLAVDNYKSDVKLFFRVFFITLFVVACFAALFFYTRIASNALMSGKNRRAADEEIAKVLKAREIFTEWNSFFDSGEYEKLCESFDEHRKEVSSYYYDWEHYDFVYIYEMIMDTYEENERLKAYENPNKYSYRGVLGDLANVKYYLNRDRYRPFPQGEMDILRAELEKCEKATCENLGMSEEDLKKFYDKCITDKYPDSDDIFEYIAERWGLS